MLLWEGITFTIKNVRGQSEWELRCPGRPPRGLLVGKWPSGLTSVPAEPPPVVVALLVTPTAARRGHEVLGATATADSAGGCRWKEEEGEEVAYSS
jgi:hypothetical protein